MAPRENIDHTVAVVVTPLRAPRSAAAHERSHEAEAEFGISRERLQARLQRPSASISTGRERRRRKQSVKRNEDVRTPSTQDLVLVLVLARNLHHPSEAL
jgi:hypothetical protein